MYYLVGLQNTFVHVEKEIGSTVFDLISKQDTKQLSYIIEMKSDKTLQNFYEYMKEWECIYAFKNTFTYLPAKDQKQIEASITPYGMLISDIPNNPLFRWFHYCYEYVLVMEILQ